MKDILKRIDEDSMQAFADIFCRFSLDATMIIWQLSRVYYVDLLLIYSLLLDNGYSLNVNWFQFDTGGITAILESYSDEIEDFDLAYSDDENDIACIVFIAVCTEKSDKLIMALIRRAKFNQPAGAFIFLLLARRSEGLIRFFLTHQQGDWGTIWERKFPSNVDIPLSLLDAIVPCFDGVGSLSEIIPNSEKYVAALHYIAKHHLWTPNVSLLGVVKWEIRSRRVLVLQAVLEIATEDDFYALALHPIFEKDPTSMDMALECLAVMEYLQAVPYVKLAEVIKKAGPQSPSVLDPKSTHPLSTSMLPLIYRIALANPKSFHTLLSPEHRHISCAICMEA